MGDRARVRYRHDGSGWCATLPSGDVLAFPGSGGVYLQRGGRGAVVELRGEDVRLGGRLRKRRVMEFARRVARGEVKGDG